MNRIENRIDARIENCVCDIKAWMTANKLKLNDDKSELLVISSTSYRKYITTDCMTIGDTTIQAAASARNLGAIFDSAFNQEEHVKSICQSAYMHLRNIRSIRHMLTKCTCEKLVHAFVTSRLDNGNSLLYGLPQRLLMKLQRIQNSAARVVARTRLRDSITPVLRELHWLPVRERIAFKLMLLTWRALHGTAPTYISDLIIQKESTRQLRSSSSHLLVVPRMNLKTYGDRSFAYAAPTIWNSLPMEIKTSRTLPTFKSKLKSFLYKKAYNV